MEQCAPVFDTNFLIFFNALSNNDEPIWASSLKSGPAHSRQAFFFFWWSQKTSTCTLENACRSTCIRCRPLWHTSEPECVRIQIDSSYALVAISSTHYCSLNFLWLRFGHCPTPESSCQWLLITQQDVSVAFPELLLAFAFTPFIVCVMDFILLVLFCGIIVIY